MKPDDDPKLTLDENEWRCYKRATRNLRHKQRMERTSEAELPILLRKQFHNKHKQRMERTSEAEPLAWLRAVDWNDDGDPVLARSEMFSAVPVELVA